MGGVDRNVRRCDLDRIIDNHISAYGDNVCRKNSRRTGTIDEEACA